MKEETGKGGKFDTRVNPFLNNKNIKRLGPNLTETEPINKSIQSVLNADCALIISKTRDGGAIVLTILDGNDRHRTYCSNDTEIQDAFDAMEKMYET